MFPLRDENPTLHASIVTYLIIGLNVAAWVFLQGLGLEKPLMKSVFEYGLIPGELLGRLETGSVVQVARHMVYIVEEPGRWLTVFTSMFMHGGWFHLISNMWFLAVFGDNVEDAMGRVRFLVFYLLCGLAAAAAQILSDPSSHVPMVGASGAIGGVMGAYAILYPRAPVHVLVFLGFFMTRLVLPAVLLLGYWFFLQILGGLPSMGGSGGGVAFWAHVGGFLAGVVLVRRFCQASRLQRCRGRRGRTTRWVERTSWH